MGVFDNAYLAISTFNPSSASDVNQINILKPNIGILSLLKTSDLTGGQLLITDIERRKDMIID